MDLGELQELIRILEASGLAEIEIEEDDRRIRLSKPAVAAQHFSAMPTAAPAPAPSAPVAAPAEETEDENGLGEGLVSIDSPMVGTFYSAAAPGEPPFVLPGDRVKPDQTICIVEAMKIMNEVAAKEAGVIERVLVENGEAVEFGQPLFALRPNA